MSDKINFIKIPCLLSDKKQEEIMGKKEWVKSFCKVNPFYIVSYTPASYKDEQGENIGAWVELVTHGIQSSLTVEQIEQLLDSNKI